ncbi:MAG: hypothetical protein IJP48_01930 [Synergistaceae bacterium]|nr:hypothetical protein [Synergistaceae bacterium]
MMRASSKKLLAALVISGVLSISGAAFASVKEVKASSLVGDIVRGILEHNHRAQTPPPPPEFRNDHRPPPPPDGKFRPRSHDMRPDGKRLPPPPKGDKRPPEPPREPRGLKPHMPPHHRPMARR